MSGYLGAPIPLSARHTEDSYHRERGSFGYENFSNLSMSPHVREEFYRAEEELFTKSPEGYKPPRMTGRYKYVASIIQKQLEQLLSDPMSIEKLKKHGFRFSGLDIDRFYHNLQKFDESDVDDVYEDPWHRNIGWILESYTSFILRWVQKNAEGPVSVI